MSRRVAKGRAANAAPIFAPAAPERWGDIETLFGPNGACEGCWCMFWRAPSRASFRAMRPPARKAAFRAIVAAGPPPGVIGYVDGAPVAWCSVAPRAAQPALDASRIAGPAAEADAWAIGCLFVRGGHRGRGLASAAIEAGARFAFAHGARVVEAYPRRATPGDWASALYMGTPAMFEAAGFRRARISPSGRTVYRLVASNEKRAAPHSRLRKKTRA